jgi:ribose-phosphate pyrophosphokinase
LTSITNSEILFLSIGLSPSSVYEPAREQNIRALEYAKYPSGEPIINQNFFPPSVVLLRQQSMDAFIATMFWIDALVERGFPVPKLILPQVPGARQDRLNDSGDYLFTAKSVAQMINARNFPKVAVFDPHSEVIAALIDRCHVIHPSFKMTPRDGATYAGVIAPDAGAEKRAAFMAKANGLPLFRGWKTRDVATGTISGFGVQPLPPGHYLVVDDLCDAGGTFVGLAEVLTQMGCTADLYVTHGLFTKGTQRLLDCYKTVITTDSTVGEKPGVQVIPVCKSYLLNSYYTY